MGRFTNPLPELGEDASKVLDEVCREMVEQGFHVPSANYFGLMNPTPTYMGVLGRSTGGGTESAAGDPGAFATGVEDRTGNRALDWRAGRMARRIQRNIHQRRQRSQFQRPGAGAGVEVSRARWKKEWLRSAASPWSTPRRSRIIRSTSRPACWASDAKRCGGSR